MTLRTTFLKPLWVLLAVPGVLLVPFAPVGWMSTGWERSAQAQELGEQMLDKQREQAEQLEKAKREAEARGQQGVKEQAPPPGPAKMEEPKQEVKAVKLPKQGPAISPETFRMIEMIEKKNTELKKREEELTVKEQQLQTLEQNIRRDLDKIEQALAKSKEQMGFKESLIKENVDALIKVYSSMKPDQAANLIAAIDEDLALQIISGMKSKIAGQVLSQLDVKVAKSISEKLAGKNSAGPGN